MIENIKYLNQILAIIVRADYLKAGITFFTPDDFSQQLAFMQHPKGKVIEPHVHNIIKREISLTKEVLFLKKGRLRVDFYNEYKEYLESRILDAGDTILLATGGHGFEVLDDIEMLEVKQGPFSGNNDKIRFKGINNNEIKTERDEDEAIYTG